VAEILIQRKRRRRSWLWLLGLVVLALLPWPFLGNRDDTARRARIAQRDSVTTRAAPVLPDAIRPETALRRDSASRVTATAAGALASDSLKPAITPPATPPTPALSDSSFERLIARRPARLDERNQRRYIASGLRSLADELRALGASDAGVRTIRASADSLQLPGNPGTRSADYARTAFLAAVREFDVLRERFAVRVDTGRLRSTAWAVKPESSLLHQRGTVQAFFERARDALQSLSRRRR
jgi:hypothetical protein